MAEELNIVNLHEKKETAHLRISPKPTKMFLNARFQPNNSGKSNLIKNLIIGRNLATPEILAINTEIQLLVHY
jgi:hypothetical protein